MEHKKFWKFVNLNDDETELQIYSDIASHKTTDFWSGEKSDEVTPKDFLAELKEVKSNNICVRINSNGGDVFAANAIATALEEAVNNGKCVTCKIDGICASAAVRIALACSKVSIANGAYMMIHKPSNVMWGYYNSDEMRKSADTLDAIQRGIAGVYAEKTGLSEKECEKLMDKETWFTAEEAVEKGFANEILFVGGEGDEGNSEDVLNRIKNAFVASAATCEFTNVPKALIKAFENKTNFKKEGEQPMEVKNYSDLKTAYPDLVSSAENKARDEGVEAERARIKEIDNLAGKINPTLLNEAKYGKVTMTAEEVIVKAFKEDKMLGRGYLNAAEEDTKDNETVEQSVVEEDTKVDEEEETKNYLVNAAKNVRKTGGNK